MSNSIKILVHPLRVAEAVLDFSLIEGVEVHIPVNENLSAPDDQRHHPAYKLDFAQLGQVVVSVTGVFTSVITLAAAIYKLKSETKENKTAASTVALTQETAIEINYHVIPLSKFRDKEALIAYLQKNLNRPDTAAKTALPVESIMNHQIDDLVLRVSELIGRPTATAFVTPESEDRHFIGEALLIGAALFLINRYFGGFFKPIENAGVRHREAAVRVMKGLFNGSISEEAKDEARQVINDTQAEAKSLDTPERRAAAEKEIQNVLREYGESEVLAAKKAAEMTGVIFGN